MVDGGRAQTFFSFLLMMTLMSGHKFLYQSTFVRSTASDLLTDTQNETDDDRKFLFY